MLGAGLCRYQRRAKAVLVLFLSVLIGCSGEEQGVRGNERVLPSSRPPVAPALGEVRTHGLIAFASARDGELEIFVMKADGSDVRQITDNEVSDHSPSWSPDGSRIVFVRQRGRNTDLWIVAVAHRMERRLTNSGQIFEYEPEWSPDGTLIAFAETDFLGDGGDIAVMKPDGSDEQDMALQDGSNTTWSSPSWKPDSSRIAFLSDFDERDIQTVSVTGSTGAPTESWQLNPAGREADLDWSNSGDSFVLAADYSSPDAARQLEHRNIFVSRQSGELTAIDTGEWDSFAPAWSPNDQWIVYASDRKNSKDIYVTDKHGRLAERLTRHEGADIDPDWWSLRLMRSDGKGS